MSLLNIYFVSILFFSSAFIETADKSAEKKKVMVVVVAAVRRMRVGVAYKVCEITLLFREGEPRWCYVNLTRELPPNSISFPCKIQKKKCYKKNISQFPV